MESERGPREDEAPSLTAADRIAAVARAGCAGAIALMASPIAHRTHGAGQGQLQLLGVYPRLHSNERCRLHPQRHMLTLKIPTRNALIVTAI